MDEIPRDIEVAVRAAGEQSKGYAGELSTVYRRARRRRTRRRATAVATAFTVLAGLVGGGLIVRQRTDATPHYEPASTAPAQRLLLSVPARTFVVTRADSTPVELGGDLDVGELSVADDLVVHPVVGAGVYDKTIGLPDGRLVSVGPRDRRPASALDMLLTVDTPGGRPQQRAITREEEPVSLVAADSTTAFLWRPYGLYAHDLAGGLERLVIASDMLDLPNGDPAAALDAADVAGDRLLIAAKSRSCRPLLTSIAPPQGIRFLPLTSIGCKRVTGLRMSPSTGRVAVSYETSAGTVNVAVLSTEDGMLLADRQIVRKTGVTVDLAWTDERTVRGVAAPGPGDDLYELKQFTIPT
ncbi:hypothetical protein [Paractinoplanes maris]|uniref:hypothetical protein n=1 Tax=Paractinoplanes maris TaxID=1734446 RepID=UPI00202042B9|nr:hypothetical protein [Actinoplanes maris]